MRFVEILRHLFRNQRPREPRPSGTGWDRCRHGDGLRTEGSVDLGSSPPCAVCAVMRSMATPAVRRRSSRGATGPPPTGPPTPVSTRHRFTSSTIAAAVNRRVFARLPHSRDGFFRLHVFPVMRDPCQQSCRRRTHDAAIGTIPPQGPAVIHAPPPTPSPPASVDGEGVSPPLRVQLSWNVRQVGCDLFPLFPCCTASQGAWDVDQLLLVGAARDRTRGVLVSVVSTGGDGRVGSSRNPSSPSSTAK